MSKTIQLTGGRLWKAKESGVPGWSSDDDKFDILIGKGYCVLVSYDHDPIDDAEFWRKRFRTVEEAMVYAETM